MKAAAAAANPDKDKPISFDQTGAAHHIKVFSTNKKLFANAHVIKITNETQSEEETARILTATYAASIWTLTLHKDLGVVTDSADNDTVHLTKLGAPVHVPNAHRTSKLANRINVYSFALKPEEHQPSGTCNFSRIDNAQLNFTTDIGGGVGRIPDTSMNIYAVNYNVLRIMSGMGGLAYSN